MNAEHTPRDGVPEDYPGRIVRFPDGTEHLVVMLLGVQGHNSAARDEAIRDWQQLAQGSSGPARLEGLHHVDANGVPTTALLAYWTDTRTATAWWQSPPVSTFWQGLPLDGDCGFFVERMTVPQSRFNYAAGTEDKHGSAAALPLAPCTTFGYWGAYRDRLPASANDDFVSPLDAVPQVPPAASAGRRLRVQIPDNLCYIREGQGWGRCGPAERKIWETQMDPVIDVWVERLAADPAATGCLSVRDCTEFDAASGAAIERRTQIAFLLSLGHIEQAARTDPAHLAVHGAFVKMYTEPQFTPQMHVWVELGVMKRDEVFTEYVNCHPRTGLLPYFEAAPAP